MSSLLQERYPDLRATLPRLELCTTPTPVRELDALMRETGGRTPLWLKDDSRIAPAWGGNKPRKLEWTLADAKRRGCRTVLTFGGLATNHGLATALYARRHGLRCVLALVDQPIDPHAEEQLARLRSSGARIHVTHDVPRTVAAIPYLMARYAQMRPARLPYWLPPGGSSPLGALGFVEAAFELAAQIEHGLLPEPAKIVVPLGTGGTAAGLLLGLRLSGLRSEVMAVRVNDQLKLSPGTIAKLARRTHALLVRRGARIPALSFGECDVEVPEQWMGKGYGHPTPEAHEALAVAGRAEGLRLEGVYTGKAMAALLAGAREGSLGPGPVLYWNTHGEVT